VEDPDSVEDVNDVQVIFPGFAIALLLGVLPAVDEFTAEPLLRPVPSATDFVVRVPLKLGDEAGGSELSCAIPTSYALKPT
jgi:hypothetical protein